MELCALGMFQPLSSNILEFFKALPEQLRQRGITFSTPSEICDNVKSVGPLMVEYPTTWVDEERDLSPWLGNVMQQEALDKLYSVADRVRIAGDKRLLQDWDYLQASNNLRFISTKANSYGGYRGIYSSPYDAFTNYMNILGDFITRVNNLYPQEIENDELNALLTTIKNQGDELAIRDKEIAKLKNLIDRLEKQTGATTKSTTATSKKSATTTKKANTTASKSTTAKKAATTSAKKTTAKSKATPKKAEVEAPKVEAPAPKVEGEK
jgi:alpha-amylase